MRKAIVFLSLRMFAISADLTGQWHLTLIRFGEPYTDARVDFTSEGTRVTGTSGVGTWNELKFEGTSENNTVKLRVTRRNGEPFGTFEGRVDGGQMQGAVSSRDVQLDWKARRLTPREGPSRTHTFQPVKFHRVFSGAIEPALRIEPGDTVRTWTVDASGRDANKVQRSLGGNPQTGPFYVEGAMPGDAVAVKFHRIRLNRDSAHSGRWISPQAVTPQYFKSAKIDTNFDPEWKLDRMSGFATLARPTERLKDYRVKLNPMLGCVAVAPSGNESIRTGSLGEFGGNMDYSGVREGVTVYLPVFVPGALLFIGDGHAAQGDGELNGDALETSMDVEFTVQLIQNKAPRGPRIESDEWLMASGIAHSFSEALQEATTALARWLEHDFNLSETEVAMVVGTSIRYDIAEVVDDLVHIMAKVNKEALEPLKR
jgi:amidase